ncbi:hypothetical protein HI914_06594 [Erysiphe necator]|nr:hypothetical protein HI914_06594 [Erysiphe necator]
MPRSNLAQLARRKKQTRLNFESVNESSPVHSSSSKVKNDSSDDSITILPSSHPHSRNDLKYDFRTVEKSLQAKPKDIQPTACSVDSPVLGKFSELITGRNLYAIPGLYNTRVHAICRIAKNKKSTVKTNGLDSSEGSEAESDIAYSVKKLPKPEAVLACKQRLTHASEINMHLLRNELPCNDPNKSSEDDIKFVNTISNLQKSSSPKKFGSSFRTNNKMIVIDSSDDESPITSSNMLTELPPQKICSPLKRHRVMSKDQASNNGSSPMCRSDIQRDNSDDSEDIVSPVKRMCHTRSKEKKINLKMQSTGSESNASFFLKRRSRQQITKRHRTDKEKALELMKRKRAGERIDFLTESELSSDGSSDDKFETLSVFDDEDGSIEQNERDYDEENIETNYSDFVVNNDDELFGVPDHMAFVPLQFTHTAHKPLKDHFRDVVEWMVKDKVYPAFAREDEVYLQAFRKLDDICQGLAKSKFISTQWTLEFTQALWKYPYFISGPLSEEENYKLNTGVPKCDACNRRKHIPTSYIQFDGQAYDKKTLIAREKTQSNGEVSRSRNKKAYSKQVQWLVGSICKRNAQYSHSLIHWKFALNEWVIDCLSHEGHFNAEKSSAEYTMDTVQLDQYANNIVDTWESKGIIMSLYRDWKIQRKIAEELT